MSAIERCRTAALGGHIARCGTAPIRRLPTTPAATGTPEVPGRRREAMARRAPSPPAAGPYYHVVFTLPAPIANIAYQNKAVIYDLLFKASTETLTTIAADPKHLAPASAHLVLIHGARRSPIIRTSI